MEDFEYCGRSIDLTTLTKNKFLRYKLLGYPKHPNGVFSVFINATSVVIFRNADFIQLRVIKKNNECYLRIDTSKKDLSFTYNDCNSKTHVIQPFEEGYIVSYPIDFISLSSSLYEVHDCSRVEYKGVNCICMDNEDFQSDGDLTQYIINTFVVPDAEYDNLIDCESIGTIHIDFSGDSFAGVRFGGWSLNISFPFVEEPTIRGISNKEITLNHHFNRFMRKIGFEGRFNEPDFIMMQSTFNDDIIFFNKKNYVQFSVMSFDNKNYLRIESNCTDLIYSDSSRDDFSELTRGIYLLSEGTYREVELTVKSVVGNSEIDKVNYMGCVYRLVPSYEIMCSRDWIGRKCIMLNYNDFDVSLTVDWSKFVEVHTNNHQFAVYSESGIRLLNK